MLEQPPTVPQRATGVRYAVLAFLCVLAMLAYLDRQLVTNSKNDIMAALGRDPRDWFWVLVAFQLAYALFEVPTGWMGDVYGPRRTLLRVVVWWSAFLALTALAGYQFGPLGVLITFPVLVVCQFLFGAGEAGAFPNIAKALYNWFPASSRGFAQGSIWMSARFMGGLTPLTWLALTDARLGGLSWREAFFTFAGVALVWCAAFLWYFRNKPEQHAGTNAAEQALIDQGRVAGDDHGHAGTPWGKILSSRNLWAVCGMYFCLNFSWYFTFYFLPGLLKEQLHAKDPAQSAALGDSAFTAFLSGAPLLLGIVGCWLGGVLSDAYVRRTGDRRWGRRLYPMIGFGMAGACYVLSFGVLSWGREYMLLFGVLIGLVGFFNDLTMASCWATCQDIGRRYAATVSGFMNMIGNLGSTLTIAITGSIIKAYTPENQPTQAAGYQWVVALCAASYFVGCACWLLIDASKPIVAEDERG